MSYTEIPFGLKDGKLITVQDVPDNVHGIDCDCVCPSCHKPLVIIRAKDKRTHFRHKASEMHCHYNYDEQTLNYVWNLLEESGLTKDISLDDLKYFRINSLTDTQQNNHLTHKNSHNYVEDIDRDHHLMKIVMNGETFQIKLGLQSIGDDPETIYINLKDFNIQNSSQEDILSNISQRINQQIKYKQEETISREFLKSQITQIKQSVSKPQPIKEGWDQIGEIVKILPKKCPKCGASMCKRKAHNGTVIVCSSYPACDMTAQKLMNGDW